jgi:hypothetical protein
MIQGNSVNSGLLLREPATTNINIFFGDDFEWADAALVFPTLDKTIAAFNAGAGWDHGLPLSVTLSAQYSTPRTFLDALAQEQGQATGSRSRSTVYSPPSPAAGAPVSAPSSSSNPSASSSSSGPGFPSSGPGFPVRPSWDMLPHGFEVDEFQWWTGFITSRPECKRTGREEG